MDLLNQILSELKTTFRSKTLPLYKLLNENYSTLLSTKNGSTNLLISKMKYDSMISNYDLINRIIRDSGELDIDTARKVFKKIIINADSSVSIKISLTDDKRVYLDGYELIHETWFTYIKLFKPITIQVFVYFEGVRVIST